MSDFQKIAIADLGNITATGKYDSYISEALNSPGYAVLVPEAKQTNSLLALKRVKASGLCVVSRGGSVYLYLPQSEASPVTEEVTA